MSKFKIDRPANKRLIVQIMPARPDQWMVWTLPGALSHFVDYAYIDQVAYFVLVHEMTSTGTIADSDVHPVPAWHANSTYDAIRLDFEVLHADGLDAAMIRGRPTDCGYCDTVWRADRVDAESGELQGWACEHKENCKSVFHKEEA